MNGVHTPPVHAVQPVQRPHLSDGGRGRPAPPLILLSLTGSTELVVCCPNRSKHAVSRDISA